MTDRKINKSVRLTYGIIFSVFTFVVAALFLWQLFTIFTSSDAAVLERRPFTRDIVVAALSKIDLYFWLWVGCIFAGFVLFEVFPVKEKPHKISADLQYARLVRRLPQSAPQGKESEFGRVMSTRKVIFSVKCAAWALFAVACVYGIVYLCIPSHFNNKNVSLEMLDMVKCVFPCIFAGLLLICCAEIYEKYAVKDILPAVRTVTNGVKAEEASVPNGPVALVLYNVKSFLGRKWVIPAIRIGLAVLAVALIIWGALNGNMRGILIKATNICTECIGLG